MATEIEQSADVLVVFGITGDLARVMTFRSLYRLEARGLLDCPIVGVAVDDWTVDAARRARPRRRSSATGEALDEDVFARFAARLSYVSGDFADAETYQPGRRCDRGRQPAGLLPRDPAVPVRPHVVKGLAEAGLTGRARGRREAVRARPRLRPGARRRAAPVRRRGSAATGSTTTSGRWASRRSSSCGSPTRCSSRSGTGITSPRSRSRWPRRSASRTAATSTTRSARCATSSSTT